MTIVLIGSDTQSKSTARYSKVAEQRAVTQHCVPVVCKEIENGCCFIISRFKLLGCYIIEIELLVLKVGRSVFGVKSPGFQFAQVCLCECQIAR